jgi:hypothetical protein
VHRHFCARLYEVELRHRCPYTRLFHAPQNDEREQGLRQPAVNKRERTQVISILSLLAHAVRRAGRGSARNAVIFEQPPRVFSSSRLFCPAAVHY